MLEPATLHEEELKRHFAIIALDLKYQFYGFSNWSGEYEVRKNTYDKVEYAVLNVKKEVIGYLAYCIERIDHSVTELVVIHFTQTDKLLFGMDLYQMIDDIFIKYSFRKIKFSGFTANPIIGRYESLCRKYGGNIVGIQHEDAKLLDGNYYDRELFEIFREQYLLHRPVYIQKSRPEVLKNE